MAEEEADVASADDHGRAGLDRRKFLQRVGVGTAIAWTAPQVISQPAFAASTVTPPFTDPFIVVGGDGSGRTFTTDDDGVTWPVNTTPIATGEVHAVAYSPLGTKWISVGRNGTNAAILTSVDDGVSWTPTGPTPTGRLLDVATDGLGNWVAVGEANPGVFPGNPLVLFSGDNGVSWSAGSVSTTINDLHGLATDGVTWIAAGQNDSGNAILTLSTDAGATWAAPIALNPAGGGHVFDVASGSGGRWLAVGSVADAGGNDSAAIWFVNGGPITAPGDWTPVVGPWGSGRFSGVTSNNGVNFVGVGTHDPSGPGFSFSFDPVGATPGTFALPIPDQLHGVATDQAGVWIAVGGDGTGMRTYTSTDNGVNWLVTSQPASGFLLGASARVVA